MNQQVDEKYYYINQKSELLERFDEDGERWRHILCARYGSGFAEAVLKESREEFETLIPQIPYIGGDESWAGSLVESVRCLAFYKAMKKRGKAAEEAGKLLYDAIMLSMNESQASVSPNDSLTPEQRMERRKRRAEMSQKHWSAEGYVWMFVAGDGNEFDYGYDFVECAAQKFYHAQGTDEFLPFYCFLDYAYSKISGLGLARTMTLAEGHDKCDHHFKNGRRTELEWPPPFLK